MDGKPVLLNILPLYMGVTSRVTAEGVADMLQEALPVGRNSNWWYHALRHTCVESLILALTVHGGGRAWKPVPQRLRVVIRHSPYGLSRWVEQTSRDVLDLACHDEIARTCKGFSVSAS